MFYQNFRWTIIYRRDSIYIGFVNWTSNLIEVWSNICPQPQPQLVRNPSVLQKSKYVMTSITNLLSAWVHHAGLASSADQHCYPDLTISVQSSWLCRADKYQSSWLCWCINNFFRCNVSSWMQLWIHITCCNLTVNFKNFYQPLKGNMWNFIEYNNPFTVKSTKYVHQKIVKCKFGLLFFPSS